ncbi:MAG: type III-B CRISPR module-associated protein Cmr5 [Clostridiales bacterium]|nr:type III-B CRISPR module-associated protein Cmr5 [Clostridiales bacterium]
MNKSLEILRADYAYECVSKVAENNKKYLSLVRSFPIIIHNNGYMAAIAYLFSKKEKEKEFKLLYGHIIDWLKKRELNIEKGEEFISDLTKKSNEEYRLISKETTAFLIWLKRFAEGMITNG